jgi:hypothetical protein
MYSRLVRESSGTPAILGKTCDLILRPGPGRAIGTSLSSPVYFLNGPDFGAQAPSQFQ